MWGFNHAQLAIQLCTYVDTHNYYMCTITADNCMYVATYVAINYLQRTHCCFTFCQDACIIYVAMEVCSVTNLTC